MLHSSNFLTKMFIFIFRDIERYYFDMLQTNLRIDYKMALELTSGILILELIHRIFVCVFEVGYNKTFVVENYFQCYGLIYYLL